MQPDFSCGRWTPTCTRCAWCGSGRRSTTACATSPGRSPLAASPLEAVYPACSRDPAIRHDRLGTSVGWSDVYPYSYPEQWIDVTGLRGRFAFVQIADPDRLLIEASHANDVSETYVRLPSGRVLGRRVGVFRP